MPSAPTMESLLCATHRTREAIALRPRNETTHQVVWMRDYLEPPRLRPRAGRPARVCRFRIGARVSGARRFPPVMELRGVPLDGQGPRGLAPPWARGRRG